MTLYSGVESPVRDALTSLGVNELHPIHFEFPKQESQGHISTTVAMSLAKVLGKAPRAIAEDIINHLGELDGVDKVEIAGPGFINFTFHDSVFHGVLRAMYNAGETIGKLQRGEGKSVNVEYVSANPTGPLHAGHGRNCALGDTVANLYHWNGYDVTREYYFNNAGNQMNKLGESVQLRTLEALGETIDFPEDGYQGEYISLIAEEIKNEFGSSFKNKSTEEQHALCRTKGEEWCFAQIKNTLRRLDINHDVFFNESDLYESGAVEAVVKELRQRDLVYEKDGATWFALEKLGNPQDKVIIKSTGEATYRLPDIAYHRVKIQRGYDTVVDIFGADHIATIPDVVAGVKALGFPDDVVKTVIHQMVTFIEDGQVLKFSKRSGKSFTLDELIDEVGADVVRFFFIMRAPGTHLDFDLGLAKEEGEKNPVFYLQYAHARIASILRKGAQEGITPQQEANLSGLTHAAELSLISLLSRFESVVARACDQLEPHQLTDYLRDLAASYHQFYHECRILGSGEPLQSARLTLAFVTQRVLFNGLSILGVTAPEKM